MSTSRGLGGTSRAQRPAPSCPRSPSSAFWGAREPYLVGDDRPVVVFPGVQLPAAELAPPATRDSAATDPAQRAAWGTQGSAPQFPATSPSPCALVAPRSPHLTPGAPQIHPAPTESPHQRGRCCHHLPQRPVPKPELTVDLLERDGTQEVNEGGFLLDAGFLVPPPEIPARKPGGRVMHG